jgi:hypothetical protein
VFASGSRPARTSACDGAALCVIMSAASSPVVSAALAEANRLLLERRAELKATRAAGTESPRPEAPAARPLSFEHVVQARRHLGWHSANVAVAMRRARARQEQARRAEEARSLTWLPARAVEEPPKSEPPEPPVDTSIKLYPDIALGMLRRELEAAGRVWLLLRHIDRAGRGWVDVEEARRRLTKKDAGLRVCGWRQLRNLLRQGEGVFWERDKERVWLRSTTKAAASLGVVRLSGRPVALPVTALCQGIGEVRAHFYASFHSGRADVDGEAMPIARATLEAITSVPPRTQRKYEERVGAAVRENYAIGEAKTEEALQERLWQHGRAVFALIDRKGVHGEKNREYVAWQMANSYTGPHEQRPRGRQRHLNRKLADLRDNGDAGNGRDEGQGDGRAGRVDAYERRYCSGAVTAAGALCRGEHEEMYWRRRVGRWYVLGL